MKIVLVRKGERTILLEHDKKSRGWAETTAKLFADSFFGYRGWKEKKQEGNFDKIVSLDWENIILVEE